VVRAEAAREVATLEGAAEAAAVRVERVVVVAAREANKLAVVAAKRVSVARAVVARAAGGRVVGRRAEEALVEAVRVAVGLGLEGMEARWAAVAALGARRSVREAAAPVGGARAEAARVGVAAAAAAKAAGAAVVAV
jgi:hypothetical protein